MRVDTGMVRGLTALPGGSGPCSPCRGPRTKWTQGQVREATWAVGSPTEPAVSSQPDLKAKRPAAGPPAWMNTCTLEVFQVWRCQGAWDYPLGDSSFSRFRAHVYRRTQNHVQTELLSRLAQSQAS